MSPPRLLKSSPWLFVLASDVTSRLEFVQQEVGHAFFAGKSEIPGVWDMSPESLPGWLGHRQCLDLRSASYSEEDLQIVSIAKRIRADRICGALIAAALSGGRLRPSRTPITARYS